MDEEIGVKKKKKSTVDSVFQIKTTNFSDMIRSRNCILVLEKKSMTMQMNPYISQVGLGYAVVTVPKSQWLKTTKVYLSHYMSRVVGRSFCSLY